MNILSIGNSFSQDAQRYLQQIAKADGVSLNAVNLYIGGCSLSLHYRNMLRETKNYELGINGTSTGFFVSLKEALLNRDWDVVTLQQASHLSPDYETYQPYLNKLVTYVRDCVPKAKITIHQTWAYEQDSEKLTNLLGYSRYTDMFNDIKAAYKKAAEDTGAELIIPSGELFCRMLANGIPKVHRDTFHASLGLGRYALGLLWYKMLTGCDIKGNAFEDFDEVVSPKEIEIIKKCVAEVCEEYTH